MLNDARSLWNTAQKAIAIVNENVTTALENFEADNFGDIRLTQHQQYAENTEQLQQLQHDLDEYKRLLEDAQMHHFELSKQSRILVAEKDAELQQYRQKFGTLDGGKPVPSVAAGADGPPEIGPDGMVSGLDYEKIFYEKKVLELSCDDLQMQLKEALQGQNEFQVLKTNHEDLTTRFKSMKTDLVAMKAELERKERQKGETIENLVQEYSRLAAEAELSQTICNKRIAEVFQENEVLTTKMHALEHSITELADRSANAPSPSTPVTSLTIPTATAATPVAATAVDGEGINNNQAVSGGQLEAELKESKAKVVNLQFDMKMKDDEINKLKAMYLEATANAKSNTSAESSSTESEVVSVADSAEYKQLLTKLALETTQREGAQRGIERLQKELQNTSQDVSRLTVEKQEAEDAGKSYLEQCKKMEKEISEIRSSLQQSVDTASANDEQKRELEKEQNDQIYQMKSELIDRNDEISKLKVEAEKLEQQLVERKQHAEQEVQQKTVEISDLEKKIQLADTLVEEMKAAAVSEKQQFSEKLAEMEDALKKQKEEYEARLAAATAGSDSAQQELIADYTAKIEKLEEECKNKENDLQVVKQELSVEKASLVRAEERITNQDQTILNATNEKDQLISSHVVELETLEQKIKKDCEAHASKDIENALAEAASTALKDKESALLEMKQNLESEYEAKSNAAREAFAAEKAAVIEETAATMEQAKVKALETQQNQHEDQMQAALEKLRQEKDNETNEKIVTLRNEMNEEKRSALEEASLKSASELKAVQDAAAEQLNIVKKEMADVKAELAVIEETHKQKMADALAALETRKNDEREAALTAQKNEMEGLVAAANAERDEHLANYAKERKLRKKVHNRLLELQGNIRVMCRVRPILEVERKSGEDVDVTEIPNEDELIVQRDQHNHRTRYEYDRVFSQTSTQEEVFEAVQPLCVSVLDGYNVCIFAYGQTGSGKTYTMEGYGENKGVTPRAIAELLNQVEQMQEQATYTLTLSMLEIYNETILDLLGGSNTKVKLDIRQTPDGNQVMGLSETEITSMEQVRELMAKGQKNRAVGSHDMNEHSSRSHSILTIVCRGKNHLDNTTSYGKLHLIDLAGSERISKTDATGERLKEAQNINKSLSALGDVINALGNKKATHIPYRNSKLTFLLQDSLGGNSKVMTFVNISPAIYNLGETVCSLNFATRCRSTELGQAKKQVGDDSSTASGNTTSSSSTARSTTLRDRRSTTSASGTNLSVASSMSPSASRTNLASGASPASARK